eukprot:Partr_v1_DN23403_c0_g1_i1_m52603 putative Bifunctional enzyme that catalyzes the enolization of 2,3-diketo-5-methylthiopentyl-1-phosphate (DK-MTP-1-P) into the intermediate 2-hydroxy-3-keto-5-methylthiopentenyl-1-phosphate (HK-MTPenyl-1-P), which is then dephosphorylated to form the acireductone 1,2-dihydroxy-3-keto-5-methylthiopentene (DHK-MTPene) (By similarity)
MTRLRQRVILTDIEGTTTPISFVRDVLFPYILDHLVEFLRDNWSLAELQPYLQLLKDQADHDALDGTVAGVVPIGDLSSDDEDVRKSVVANIRWQMSVDRKSTALKAFQGLMWKKGYEDNVLKGVVYPDVVEAFETWKEQQVKVYIYSSGSVEAQKLIFGHSDHGDLRECIAGYFDTSVGSKVDSRSYEAIANEISVQPSSILFVSDNAVELAAASKIGMMVALAVRPGNAPISAEAANSYQAVFSFAELML